MSADFVIGIHAVSAQLRQAPGSCRRLLCADKPGSRLRQVIEAAQRAGIEVSLEHRARLDELCGSDKHQGCVLLIDSTSNAATLAECLEAVDANSLFLVLDGIQDPHNLGACLRSADAAGVDAVIIPRDRAVKVNPTVRKVAAGAAESVVLLEVTNLARALEQLKQAGVWIYGTSDRADGSLYDHDYRGPVALVMGAEGKGLRRLTMEACDYLVGLPMRGQVESLNVSVATGICLYEIQRARGQNA